ncbi:MAG: hypothetical protein UZ15_CFX003002498 [Chloroflexi bacterium OLB15]|nr:MAG: hypothetical protein UZ15_CFX003002498 [Chloroflexi bacterium OLB15]
MTKKLLLVTTCLIFSLLTGVLALYAQQPGITTSAEPQFSAYTCTFNTATSRAEIRATLIDGTGSAIPPESATFSVSRVGASAPLPPDAAVVTAANPRAPVQMIIVMDVTSTMPLEQVRNALLNGLLAPMPFEDSVALITFAETPSAISQFYNDKNALYNDLLFTLSFQDSPNHLNDAILAGLEATQPNSPTRQVVLVITDSTPQAEQATQEELITRAQASHTQIIPIALHNLSDTPDDEALFALANATRGYGYAYDGDKRSEAIEAGLTNIFGRVLNTLNSEVVISVDLTGQTPDETGFIPFDVTAEPNSGGTLTDRVSCPQPPAVVDPNSSENPLPQFAVASPMWLKVRASTIPARWKSRCSHSISFRQMLNLCSGWMMKSLQKARKPFSPLTRRHLIRGVTRCALNFATAAVNGSPPRQPLTCSLGACST